MAKTVKIAVTGVSGRMGQMLVKAILENGKTELAGALERPGHDWVGQDAGIAAGGSALGILVSDDPSEVFPNCDVVVDFTSPAATVAFARRAAELGAAMVIGTTGLTDEDIAAVDEASRNTAIVRAGNMSLGVNLLVQLTRKVAAALDDDYDIEVIEAHHRHKVDAPSGTALMLGEAAATGRGLELGAVSDRGRDGITGARGRGQIGFSAIRGGDVIGEHDVMFAADGERITLRHVASDRTVFANGALKAAIWASGRAPGHYSMLDVLGLA